MEQSQEIRSIGSGGGDVVLKHYETITHDDGKKETVLIEKNMADIDRSLKEAVIEYDHSH